MTDCHRPPARGKCVRDVWRAWLPNEKAQVFHKEGPPTRIQLRHVERVTRCGYRTVAAETLRQVPASCRHNFGPLQAADPDARWLASCFANFQGQRGQRSARMLPSQRLQFLHKVSTLEEMVEDLGKEFRLAADDLAEETSLNRKKMWAEVDADHCDLNTCLREAIVVFKSFLIALPESQLVALQNAIREQSQLQEAL